MLMCLLSLLYPFLSFSYVLALDLSLTEGGNPLPNSYANITWSSLDTDPTQFVLALIWPNENSTAPRTVSGQTGMLLFHFGGSGNYVVVARADSDTTSQELAHLDISVQPPPTTESTVITPGITTTSSTSETVSPQSISLTDSTTITSERHSTVITTSTTYTTHVLNAHTEASANSTPLSPVTSAGASTSIPSPSPTASSTPLSATSETSSNSRSVILGSVFGSIALVGCLILIAFYVRKRQRKKRYQRSATFYRDMMVRSPGLSYAPVLARGEKDSSNFESAHSPPGAVPGTPARFKMPS